MLGMLHMLLCRWVETRQVSEVHTAPESRLRRPYCSEFGGLLLLGYLHRFTKRVLHLFQRQWNLNLPGADDNGCRINRAFVRIITLSGGTSEACPSSRC
jgi:hypothetical protein